MRGLLLIGLLGCGEAPPGPSPEPVDRVADLRADAATMKEMAEQLTASSGVRFTLAPGTPPDRRLADPYQVSLPRQKLKEHLLWLEKDLRLWRFTWTGEAYEIRVLNPQALFR